MEEKKKAKIKLNYLKGIPLYISALFFVGLAFALIFTGYGESIPAFIVYPLAAYTFGKSIFIIYTLEIRKVENKLILLSEKFSPAKRFLQDYSFRTLVHTGGSFTISLIYALYNSVMGIALRSIWFGGLAAYFIMLSIMRFLILNYSRKTSLLNKKEKRIRDYCTYKNCGIMLFVLILAFEIAVIQMVYANKSYKYQGNFIYVAAAYTFYKITFAIIHIIKSRKTKNPIIQSIRHINGADALVSIVALQTALLSTFGDGNNVSIPNLLTGTGACLLIAFMGVCMIIDANKKFKRP